jgi:hypothetical protein
MIGRNMTARQLCHRPTVFFFHLRHVAPLFPPGKNRRVFKNVAYFLYLVKIT